MNLKKRFFQKKKFWMPVAAGLCLIGIAAFWLFNSGMISTKSKTTNQAIPSYQTTKVRKGDLAITATGSGSLVAGNSVDMSFSTEGIVEELYVKAGDKVTKGMKLAKMNNAKSLEAQVATNKLTLLQAQQSLNDLQDAKDVNLAQAYQDMLTAQTSYNDALKKTQRENYARCSEQVNKNNLALLDKAEARLVELAKHYYGSETWVEAKNVYDTAKANYDYCIKFTADEKVDFQASLSVADVTLKQVKTKYETLKASAGIDPDELKLAEAKVEEAQIKYDKSLEDLDGSTLTSTIDGTVTYLKANVGAYVDTTTYITISDLTTSDVNVSINESDLQKLYVGAKATAVFDALPEETYSGKVIQVNPELSSSGQYRVATAVIGLDNISGSKLENLPLGVVASIKIISGEATDALLVPAGAVRSIGNDQYGVFAVGSDGNMTFKLVEVGLKDSSTAEIKSGLELNETVSTGLGSGSN
jgi:HlyD family secretion protein